MTETVFIRGNEYPAPHIDNLSRKQVKKLKPVLTRLQREDLEALWDVVGLFIPSLPVSDLDSLTLGECKQLLTDAGIADFEGSGETRSDITMGESTASTGS